MFQQLDPPYQLTTILTGQRCSQGGKLGCGVHVINIVTAVTREWHHYIAVDISVQKGQINPTATAWSHWAVTYLPRELPDHDRKMGHKTPAERRLERDQLDRGHCKAASRLQRWPLTQDTGEPGYTQGWKVMIWTRGRSFGPFRVHHSAAAFR